MYQFQSLGNHILAGSSQSGKSTFAKNIIKYHKKLFQEGSKIKHIFWFSSTPTPYKIKGVKYFDRFPTIEDFKGSLERKLIIIDDFLCDLNNSAAIKLFLNGSHHFNATILLLIQNLFHKNLRTISLSAHYIILFRNPRDSQQVQTLFSQIFGAGNAKRKLLAFEDACSKPYSYILIDLSQVCPDDFRLRTQIFPGEFTKVYTDIKK